MAAAAWLGRRGASQAVVGQLDRELVRMRGKIETGGNGWEWFPISSISAGSSQILWTTNQQHRKMSLFFNDRNWP